MNKIQHCKYIQSIKQNQQNLYTMSKINYKKGLDFENEVAKYVVEEMKFDDSQVRPNDSGSTSDKGFEIDVLAKVNDKGSEMYKSASIVCLIAGLFALALCIFNVIDDSFIFFMSFVFIGVSIFYISYGEKLMAKYVWIECKSLSKKADRNMIMQLVYKYNDYQKKQEKKYNIVNKLFFSESGFNNDAKQFAKENGVICYEKNANKFKEVNLNF